MAECPVSWRDGKVVKVIMYYVYILRSKKNNRYYIGSSKNPEERLKRHNSGDTEGNRYNRPFEIVYKQEFSSKIEAVRKEREIKKRKNRKYIDKLIGV